MVEARQDPTLAVRPVSSQDNASLPENTGLSRRVVMVTTKDRLQIPPIRHFWELVKANIPPQVDSSSPSKSVY